MSRFLITTWPGGGNVPPALNLGVRLARRGHDVLVAGWKSMAGSVAEAGLPFASMPSVPPWPAGLPLDDDWDRLDEMLHGADAEDDIVEVGANFRPDVVVVDCMSAAAWRAASRLGAPAVVLTHLLYRHFAEAADVISPGLSLADAAHVLALVPQKFDRPGAVPANTSYVGPILHPTPPVGLAETGLERVATPGPPWVLLSLSTTLMQQHETLPPLLDALAALPVRVLLTTAGVLATDAIATPHNVTVRDFVPHASVLPYMAAVVTHGGLSTITTALAYGVPLVVAPQGRDQHLNAARVVEAGVGRAIENSGDGLAHALNDVLANPAIASQARRFATDIDALGRGEHAVVLVERAAALETVTSRRLRRSVRG